MIFLLIKLMFGLVFSFSLVQASLLEAKLEDFHKNPKQFYMRHIPKYDLGGKLIESNVLNTKRVSEVAKIKMSYRDKFFKVHKGEKKYTAPPGDGDIAKRLVDGANPIDNIFEIDNKGLTKSSLDESPWSGDYWAIYRGILGNRFLDDAPLYFLSWKEHYDYITLHNFFDIFESGKTEAINSLSVSEKYDLITGNRSGELTRAMWDQGREYYDSTGNVETWMGICHGWAAAAVMVERPARSIQVLAFDGKTKLKFNPSELKGLVSYLWANSDFETRFVGGRCNYKDVERDENGRPLAPECVDTNPATWFVSAVNQIGIAKRGFVMDATPDYEVWNQPVFAYSFKYFNPQTLQQSESLSSSIVAREAYTMDKFKKYRANSVTQIVGVEMSVQYTVEVGASARDEDTASNDNIRTVSYIFDLELDNNGKILGGEWYGAEHPDFLWVPEKFAQARVHEDRYLDAGQWNGYDALPLRWQQVAQSAAVNGRVLSAIANKLLEQAQ